MVAVAHGNDMGGSIRIPAAHCGLVGLKPTRARNSLSPDFGELWGPTTHEHVLTRSVRDTAAVLDATRGMAPGDPYTAPPPTRPYLEEVGADPGRLRIGFRTLRRNGAPVDPECQAAVEATVTLLESLGHHVNHDPLVALDAPDGPESLLSIIQASVAREIDRWSAKLGRAIRLDEVEPGTVFLVEGGRSVTATQYVAATEDMNAYSRRMAAWWADGNDVFVLPTCPIPPATLDEMDPARGMSALLKMSEFAELTAPFNITGQPVVSLPLHWTADGLPVGVQLVAAYGHEDVLIRLASQLEQALPWADRHPPSLGSTREPPA
jgi:amidase